MHNDSLIILNEAEKPGTAPLPVLEPDASPDHFPGEGYRVTLFNDDHHSMDEVVEQLLKALDCTVESAVHITLQAHSKGSATVIISDKDKANRVASILMQISLVVSVERV